MESHHSPPPNLHMKLFFFHRIDHYHKNQTLLVDFRGSRIVIASSLPFPLRVKGWTFFVDLRRRGFAMFLRLPLTVWPFFFPPLPHFCLQQPYEFIERRHYKTLSLKTELIIYHHCNDIEESSRDNYHHSNDIEESLTDNYYNSNDIEESSRDNGDDNKHLEDSCMFCWIQSNRWSCFDWEREPPDSLPLLPLFCLPPCGIAASSLVAMTSLMLCKVTWLLHC